MKRTTPKMLENVCAMINKQLGGDHSIQWAYGRPRLLRANQSVDVSPRLPSGQLLEWLYAYLEGAAAYERKENGHG
jgi:hypothetical protein